MGHGNRAAAADAPQSTQANGDAPPNAPPMTPFASTPIPVDVNAGGVGTDTMGGSDAQAANVPEVTAAEEQSSHDSLPAAVADAVQVSIWRGGRAVAHA